MDSKEKKKKKKRGKNIREGEDVGEEKEGRLRASYGE